MLIEKINHYLSNRKEPKRRNKCFHPSSLHKSPKELYYHYLDGDQESFPPRIKRIFDNGHSVHSRIQKYLQDSKVVHAIEVPVTNEEYEIYGHADGIFLDSSEEVLLEVKSINYPNFFSLRESPKFPHIIQTNIYMFCLGLSRGYILYECKDDQELKEFEVHISHDILIPTLTKIKYVQHYLKLGKEPPSNMIF